MLLIFVFFLFLYLNRNLIPFAFTPDNNSVFNHVHFPLFPGDPIQKDAAEGHVSSLG